jgi:glutathione S-transferase
LRERLDRRFLPAEVTGASTTISVSQYRYSSTKRTARRMSKLVLHEYAASGNCYKVRLTAALVGLPLERREYDIMKGETRTPAFLASVNANGRIPVLQVGDRFIPESNAACYFVAENSALIPADPFDHADMLRWMFWEQYNHEPNIATLRFWMRWLGPDNLSDLQRLQMPPKRQAGNAALKLMNDHLNAREWFVGRDISLADICLFAYTDVAGDAEFDLGRYPNVVAWLDRVKAHPRYIPMTS